MPAVAAQDSTVLPTLGQHSTVRLDKDRDCRGKTGRLDFFCPVRRDRHRDQLSNALWPMGGSEWDDDRSVGSRTTALPPFFVRTLPDPL